MSVQARALMSLRPLLRRFVGEPVVMGCIAVNTLTLFLLAFEGIRASEAAVGLRTLDYVLTLYFALELVIKIGLSGWRQFRASAWNVADLVIVAASSPMLLMPLLDVSQFSAILILRTARLARLFRTMRFVADQPRLWGGIRRALRVSLAVLAALVLYNFVLGLAGCYLFRAWAPEHFGDPLRAMYSMFKVFTLEGWFEIADGIAANAPAAMASLARGFFLFAVLTGGLLGLSLANAIFVDEMVRDNNDDLAEQLESTRRELSEALVEVTRELRALREQVDGPRRDE